MCTDLHTSTTTTTEDGSHDVDRVHRSQLVTVILWYSKTHVILLPSVYNNTKK